MSENYGLDEVFIRNFMMPAVMPGKQVNMNNTNQDKFLNPDEALLRGNI